MGNNKNQMKWNKEKALEDLKKRGIDPKVWSELCAKYFGDIDVSQTDAQIHKFHAHLREIMNSEKKTT